MLEKHRVGRKHPRVDAILQVDVWFEPAVVIETIGAEITLSPIHMCAMDVIRKGSGVGHTLSKIYGELSFGHVS